MRQLHLFNVYDSKWDLIESFWAASQLWAKYEGEYRFEPSGRFGTTYVKYMGVSK